MYNDLPWPGDDSSLGKKKKRPDHTKDKHKERRLGNLDRQKDRKTVFIGKRSGVQGGLYNEFIDLIYEQKLIFPHNDHKEEHFRPVEYAHEGS